MRARGYNKRFDLYETTTVTDEFGGFTTETALLNSSWAKIETFNIGSRDSNSTDFGVLDVNNALKITTRKRNDITYNSDTQYIVYRGDKYIINTSPINVNFEDNIIQFIVVKSSSKIDNDPNVDLNQTLNADL